MNPATLTLTPIPVRGRQKRTPKDASAKKDKPGRPLMSPEEIQTSSRSRSRQRERVLTPRLSKSRSPGCKKLSILESLPVELVEKIFLYSLNVNLPRASPVLRAAVSREPVYRVLIILALWKDTTDWPAYEYQNRDDVTIPRILRPLDYHSPLDEDERGELQRSVLRCKWCTFDRILEQLPDLMRLAIQRIWVNTTVDMDGEQQTALNRFLAGEKNHRVFTGISGGVHGLHFTLSISPLVSVALNFGDVNTLEHRIASFKEFPANILRGEQGFGDKESAFVEYLRIASGFNRAIVLGMERPAISRDALQQGIRKALLEKNTEALISLLKIDEFNVRSGTPGNAPYTLPSEHFRTAVRVAENDPTIFQILLRASAESVPGEDSEITEWAMDLQSPLGDWVLDLMTNLPQLVESARDRRGSIFFLGAANRESEMARRYLGEVIGVAELPGWMEEKSFDVSSLWMQDSDSDSNSDSDAEDLG